ncbi:hypothetical protein H6F76_02000 [Leptolyngbya sp. FACHB-321]|uniref:hypothetical protein n=1 Tax=Leptolyngbya sp. FACHB-321 TaxID=2692807 RepID=UPI0016832A77|nr:hypothetical protein [Leptolyngbya sp. FACHB-321]MBD2033833.1 hypothetical protein [Leptolyngbya sp. FACHB-321]
MPSPNEIKKQALQRQYQNLQKQYEVVNTEIGYTSGAARLRSELEAESLLEQMTKIDDQLKQL